MSRIFVSSDWHFGHEKLWNFGRPRNFDERICEAHATALVGGDTLINCGDFAIGRSGENRCAALLSGLRVKGVHLIGVRGNHDPDTVTRCQRMGWDFVADLFRFTYCGKHLMFTHEPWDIGSGIDLNIHGHLHDLDGHRGSLVRDGRHVLISSELCDYRPVPLDQALRLGTPRWQKGRFVSAINAIAEEATP